MSPRILCRECVRKQEEIFRLREEIKRLQAKLRYQQRTQQEGYFGSSTPSSKKPVKANTKAENQHKPGGARHGHPGAGRTSVTEAQADVIENIDYEPMRCPDCGVALHQMGRRNRSVFELEPPQVKKIIYRLQRARCPVCRRVFSSKAPGVLPKFLLSNQLLAHVASEHYLHNVPLGNLAQKTGIGIGCLIEAMHHLAQRLKSVAPELMRVYRQEALKHADETGWRHDGQNGYAWFFGSPKTTIFCLRRSRCSRVVTEVFGEKPLPGVLVVDRYAAYNSAPSQLQYCYAHLLRDVQDLAQEFPKNKEIAQFVETTAPLLAQAMGLRRLPIDTATFYQKAKELKQTIINTMNHQATHPGIQKIQTIFRENPHRLYHWADDPTIPAENNFAERQLRRLVIARKISFGSQSDNGAKTREILMSVLATLQQRNPQTVVKTLTDCLDQLATNPHANPYSILFPDDTS
jgi:transposase